MSVRLRVFQDSPDAGDPTCICSKCHKRIKADEVPIRLYITGNLKSAGEVRFCEECGELMMKVPFEKWAAVLELREVINPDPKI